MIKVGVVRPQVAVLFRYMTKCLNPQLMEYIVHGGLYRDYHTQTITVPDGLIHRPLQYQTEPTPRPLQYPMGAHTQTTTVSDGAHTQTITVSDGAHTQTITVSDGGHTQTSTFSHNGREALIRKPDQ